MEGRESKSEHSRELAVALSGGGARGIVHIGVLAALDEAGFPPTRLSGTSMGAVVGSLYAAGISPADMRALVSRKGFLDMFSIRPARTKLLEMKYLKVVLSKHLPDDFRDLAIPLTVCATNLNTGKAEYFSAGNSRNAVLASASVPVVFAPVVVDGQTYVDGGVLDNLPAKPLVDAGYGDRLLGVEVNHGTFARDFDGMTAIAREVFHLMVANNSHMGLDLCRESIVPDMSGYGIFDFDPVADLFDMGYQATKKWLAQTKMLIPQTLSSQPESGSD